MALTARLALALTATLRTALDLTEAEAPMTIRHTQDFANGTGANQATKVFADRRTITSGSPDDSLDLSGGGLTDALGNVLVFTKVKAVLIRPAAANLNTVILGGYDNNVPIIVHAPTEDSWIEIPAGGCFLFIAPGDGVAVTAGTGDIIDIQNSNVLSEDVVYDIVIIGA